MTDVAGLVDEALWAAADAVRVGDFPDPSQAYKDKEARETKAALLDALTELQEQNERLRWYAQHLMDCAYTDYGERNEEDCTCGLIALCERSKGES